MKSLVNLSFSPQSRLLSIQTSAFSTCTNLQTVNFPPKLEVIGSLAFAVCESLTTIHLPASLKTLGSAAFTNCLRLTTVEADENIQVQSLERCLFQKTKVGEFAIWRSLTVIDASSLANGCIRRVTNPHNNTHFQVIDGVVYQGTTLVFFPCNLTQKFVIPAFVETLGGSCFRYSCVETISFEPNSHLTAIRGESFIFSTVKNFTFPDSPDLTAIGIMMFDYCTKIKDVTIPKSITSIGYRAFGNSTLAKYNLEDGSNALACIDNVIFSKNLKTIIACPPYLAVSEYIIPNTVTAIGSCAFINSHIKSIRFQPGSQLASLSKESFDEISLSTFSFDPDCPLKVIPESCFIYARHLTTIDLPRNLESIVGSAFSYTNISEFSMPDNSPNLVSINGVLYSSDETILYRFPPAKAGSFEVPKEVVTVASSAFSSCKQLKELKFADDSRLKTVKAQAFLDSSVTSVTFGSKSNDVTFETDCFALSSVVSVNLPGRMKVIKANLFKDCLKLQEISLPETTQTIESGAFVNCESLTALNIPQFCSIRSIPDGAFTNTRMLTHLELPYLVEKVSKYALPNNLESITLWCGPQAGVIDALQWLPNLKTINILCGQNLDTTGFVSSDIVVKHICPSRRLHPCHFGFPVLSVVINLFK